MADAKLKIPEVPKVGDLARQVRRQYSLSYDMVADFFTAGPVRRVDEVIDGYIRLEGELNWLGGGEVELVARRIGSRADLRKFLSEIPAYVEILDFVVDTIYEHGHHSTVDDVLNLMSDLQWLAAQGEDGAL